MVDEEKKVELVNEPTVDELKSKISELEKQLNEKDDFEDIKSKYEEAIAKKDEDIAKLKETLESSEKKVSKKEEELSQVVEEQIRQSELYKEAMGSIEELQKERAKTLVDKYINEGKILPAQKEVAYKLALNDDETFIALYKDAKPVVDLKQDDKPKSSIKVNAQRLKEYFES